MLRNRKAPQARKSGRRKRPPPVAGLSVAELAARTGVTARAVRYYVLRGLLPAPAFKGPGTRYAPEDVARIFTIRAMQQERLDLAAIRRRMSTMSPAALEAYLPATPAPTTTLTSPPPPTYGTTRWDQVTLLPGVELLVRVDVSPAVRKVVQEIVDHCVSSGAGA